MASDDLPRREKQVVNDFRNAHPYTPPLLNIHDTVPEELVDKALNTLQEAGIKLVEWRSLLYRRMGVPVIIRDFHYLVPDEDVSRASRMVEESIGLPRSIPPPLLVNTGGDFYAKACMYRVTEQTSMTLVQHLVLYPASIASYEPSELESRARFTGLPAPLCKTVLVPSPPSVYASLLRMMRSYHRYAPTHVVLESDLSELICYHLYGLENGYVDTDDDDLCEELEVDRRVEDAVRTVEAWRATNQLRDEDGWIAGALIGVVSGKRTAEDLWADK